ncbi:MAG: hypothetical protein ACK5LJ_14390 [Paracoccus sp. (in: a-proteobacteria)]
MSRLFSSFFFLVVAGGLAYLWLVSGFSVLLGGPSKNTIVNVTREVMIATAPSEEFRQIAEDAQITPKGFCRKDDDGVFGCIVELKLNDETRTMVTTLRKDDAGNWIAAE